MHLAVLKLWNFRKYGSKTLYEGGVLRDPDLIIPFQAGLNLIVGENDSGKTALVDAIKFVLFTNSREYIRLGIEDFYCDKSNERSNELRIECHFKFDVADSDKKAKNFLEWAHFNDEDEYELRIFLEAKHKDGKVSPYDIKGGIDEDGANIDARARELLRTTYLKPLRDAETELANRKGSRLSQVLDSHKAFSEKQNHFLSHTINFANKEISKFFEGESSNHLTLIEKIKEEIDDDALKRKIDEIAEEIFQEHLEADNTEGKKVAEQINSYLTSFFGKNTASQFKISETNLKGILEKLSLHLENNKAGLGAHNLLFIAVELLLLERENDYTGLRLALIEEIEAHLHPQAQMRLVEYLQKECAEKKVQMLLTTHSPNLASKVVLKNLIICKDNDAFPMGSGYTRLEAEDYSFLERFLDVTKANLFFAKGVILVEGDAENLMLPTIANIIDCNLTKNGVSVINLGALTFKYYERIFIQTHKDVNEQMKIPVSVVTDVDTKVWEYYEDGINEADLDTCFELSQNLINNVNSSYADKFENLVLDPVSSKFSSLDGVLIYFRKYLPPDRSRLPNGFNSFLKNEITPRTISNRELTDIQQKNKNLKISDHSPVQNPNIKGFVNSHWTLEYELGLSCLKEQFYTAILMAKDISYFDENQLESYKDTAITQILIWTDDEDKNPEEIAYQIYWVEMMGRGSNKVSKAIVAQFFAEILEHEIKSDGDRKQVLKTEIENDTHLNYLVEAIKHAVQAS